MSKLTVQVTLDDSSVFVVSNVSSLYQLHNFFVVVETKSIDSICEHVFYYNAIDSIEVL